MTHCIEARQKLNHRWGTRKDRNATTTEATTNAGNDSSEESHELRSASSEEIEQTTRVSRKTTTVLPITEPLH